MSKDSMSRKYLITINNPEDHNQTQNTLKEITESKFKSLIYYCMSDEVGGETNTYHTHLYIQFKNPVRFSTIKKAFTSAHIDKARGTAQQNRDYVFKEGKWQSNTKAETNLRDTHYQHGDIPIEKQGKRSDLEDLYNDIKAGMTNAQILESNPSHLERLSHIDKVRKTVLEEKYKNTWRDLTVCYIHGQTGTGKTRSIMELYGYENVYRVQDYTHPFDSYNQQPVILFDEFNGGIKIREMLNILDGYPLELKSRYANKVACFGKVFILANNPIDSLYQTEQQDEVVVWHAFLRRIHSVVEMSSKDFCIPYHMKFNNDRLHILQKPFQESTTFADLAQIAQFDLKFNEPLLK